MIGKTDGAIQTDNSETSTTLDTQDIEWRQTKAQQTQKAKKMSNTDP